MALLCFAQIGVSSVPPMFWPLPASFLTGASAAAGIAAINSLGNLSGFAARSRWATERPDGDFTAGLLLLAGCAVVGAGVSISLRIDERRERRYGGSGAGALKRSRGDLREAMEGVTGHLADIEWEQFATNLLLQVSGDCECDRCFRPS